jgi:phosphoribosylformylglycinamidine (FGAM) synthase-like enzyme
LSEGMGGSTYYDVTNGSSNALPLVDKDTLPQTLEAVQVAIGEGKILSCHDVSEGGVVTAVAEMCFGGDCGAELEPSNIPQGHMDNFLFNETAGCFVIEVEDEKNAQDLFSNVPHRRLGKTTAEKKLQVSAQDGFIGSNSHIFTTGMNELKEAWQAPMKGIFPA